MVMRAAGRDAAYIAKKIGTTEGTVRQLVFLARKNGWLDENDEPIDLETELALSVDRKVVRNIDASLDGQMTNWQTHEMTIAAAKGRGIFKTHEKTESQSQSLSVVAIRVEMPPVGAGDQQILEQNVGGVPAYIEGDVLGALPGPQEAHHVSQLGHAGDDAEEDPTSVSDGEPR